MSEWQSLSYTDLHGLLSSRAFLTSLSVFVGLTKTDSEVSCAGFTRRDAKRHDQPCCEPLFWNLQALYIYSLGEAMFLPLLQYLCQYMPISHLDSVCFCILAIRELPPADRNIWKQDYLII